MTPLEKRKLIWQLLDKGMKKKEIVEKTGIPYGTVYMYAKQKNELQDTQYDYTEKRKTIRKALEEAGMVVTDIETSYEKDTKYYQNGFSCYAEEE